MDVDAAIIKEIRKRPLLYNKIHWDLEEKEKAWKEVANCLNLDADICKKRWKMLRDSYNRWKNTMRLTKKIDKNKPRRRWRYSKQMMFLDDAVSNKTDDDLQSEDYSELQYSEEQKQMETYPNSGHESGQEMSNGGMDHYFPGIDIDRMLIEEVRDRPMLYDLDNIDYKSLGKKEMAWTEIATKLGLNKHQCKKRWKGLRDTYKRCKKFEYAGKLKTKWRCFDEMAFLENVRTCKTQGDYIDCIDDIEDECATKDQETFVTTSEASGSPFPQEEESSREKKYEKFLELAAASIAETCSAFIDCRNQQDSTSLHFASLAAKLREAQFPASITNRIEAKVATLVFSEIEKYHEVLCEGDE